MIKNFIIVAVVAAFSLSCKQPTTEPSGSAATPDDEVIRSGISKDVKSGYTNDGFSAQDWEAMVRNYKPHAGKHPVNVGKQNTRSVWFSLQKLDSLVQHLKREKIAMQQGDSTKKDGVVDGVRIYFGRYIDKASDDLKQRNTLIFVSTYWVEREKGHQDYLNNRKLFSEPINNGELSPPNTFGLSWGSEID